MGSILIHCLSKIKPPLAPPQAVIECAGARGADVIWTGINSDMLRILMSRWLGSQADVQSFIRDISVTADGQRDFEKYAKLYWTYSWAVAASARVIRSSRASDSVLHFRQELEVSFSAGKSLSHRIDRDVSAPPLAAPLDSSGDCLRGLVKASDHHLLAELPRLPGRLA